MDNKLFIDTERVIAAVHARPNIWNPADEYYKNKLKRAKTWTAICHEVFSRFDQYADEDQRELEKRVQQRWRTARDCYVKARTRPAPRAAGSGPPDPQYVFMEQLSFLKPTLRHPRPLPSALKNQQLSAEKKSLVKSTVKYVTPQVQPEPEISEDSMSSMSAFEHQLLALLQRTQTPLEDDDESFFRSLAPVLTALDPHNKLLFRSRVLATALEIQAQSSTVFLEAPPMCDVDLQEDEPPEKKYRPPDDDTSSDDSQEPPDAAPGGEHIVSSVRGFI